MISLRLKLNTSHWIVAMVCCPTNSHQPVDEYARIKSLLHCCELSKRRLKYVRTQVMQSEAMLNSLVINDDVEPASAMTRWIFC